MNTKLQQFLTNNLLLKRCCLILGCVAIFVSATAFSYSHSNLDEKISLNLKEASLMEVFTAIEKQSEYTFVFDENVTKNNQKFSFQLENRTVRAVLKKIEDRTNFQFKTLNRTITVINIAQQNINGRVTDGKGLPIPGVTVLIKNTSDGVVSDFDGNFSISAPSLPVTLVFSYMGFESKELTVQQIEFVEVTLTESTNTLDEVVVTALGIKREEKKLGFSQATVESSSLSQTIPNNWSSGLKGKVAGLNVVSAGSGPINSQQITLRGNSSFDLTQNYALIVVDGVPVNTEMTTSGSSNSYLGEDSPIDYGNGISDLNMEDIESVTVLKGPGATALYGSRAANGALIITTKSGDNAKGLGITINSGTTFDVIQRWPDWQYGYGQGTGKSFDENGDPYYSYGDSEDGNNTGSTSSAWGPIFNGQYYYQYDPELEGQSANRQLWQAYEDNRKAFWRTGFTINNNVSIQGGNEKGSMRASIGHSKNEWIMPNTGFDRITASVNSKYTISDHIKLSAVLNYNNRTSDNLPSTGYNNGTIAYFMIFQNPNVDLDWYRPIWQEGQENIQQIQPFSSYIDNPYLIAYESLNTLDSHQLVGNISTNIQLGKGLDLLLRTAINTYNQEREQKRPYSINRYAQGYYQVQNVFKQEINSDFLLSYNKKISEAFDFSISVGGNNRNEKRRLTNASVTGLVVPNVYKLSNGMNNPSINTANFDKVVNSLYGLMTFSFKNQIFLDVTGRNDWSSTLPRENWSFFYPSANASFIVSDIFNFDGGVDYLKYRFSFAQVGNDSDPYQTSKYYDQSDFPSAAVVPGTLYNENFKPEISTSYETGIEARFLKNRINLDATVYQISTKNQIIQVPINLSTGYSAAILNSGEVRNRGVELTLGGKIFDNEKFNWKTTATWSRNWGKVFDLPDNIENQYIIDSGGNADIIAKVGGSPTAIYGYGFVRSPDGQIVYDEAGLPAYPESGDIQYIGDASPDWRAGFFNQLNFGNVGFSFTFDGQYGGIIYSQSHHKLTQQGKLEHTYFGRETMEIIGDGVVLNEDGTYSPNTTPVATPDWYNRYYRRANVESNSFDASYLKLREISLQYNLPAKWLGNTGLRSAQLSVFGRNLFTVSDFPIYDPETAALNGNRIMPGVEMGQMPSPASYGFNVKLTM